jgi:hypothetical protein
MPAKIIGQDSTCLAAMEVVQNVQEIESNKPQARGFLFRSLQLLREWAHRETAPVAKRKGG